MLPLISTLLRRVLVIFLLALRLLLLLPCLPLVMGLMKFASRHPSAWKRCLELAARLRLKKLMGHPPAIWLAYYRKDKWANVRPLIQGLKSNKEKMHTASAFASLYLWNERLREAREATDYWAQFPQQWVNEHPKEARAALVIYRASSFWYPFGIASIRPAGVPEIQGLNEMKKTATSLKAAGVIDMQLMDEWKDSRLMGEFVDWLMGQRLTSETTWAYNPETDDVSPSHVAAYESVNFPRIFIRCAGVPKSEFKRMWRQATTLDETQDLAHSQRN